MKIEGQVNKEEIIDATIEVLENIPVPVRMREITERIDGAINNLLIVKQIIQIEEGNNKQPEDQPAGDEHTEEDDNNGED